MICSQLVNKHFTESVHVYLHLQQEGSSKTGYHDIYNGIDLY